MLSYGTYKLKKEDTYDMVTFALEQGIKIIDTAVLYKNQEEVLKAKDDYILKNKINEGNEKIILITKISKKIKKEEYNFFENFNIILIHNPVKNYLEIWDDLNSFKSGHGVGLSRERNVNIGVSNFNLEQLKSLNPKPYCLQIEHDKLFSSLNEIIKYCEENNIIIYSHSILTGFKIKKIFNINNLDFYKKNKNIIPIIGTSNKTHFLELINYFL